MKHLDIKRALADHNMTQVQLGEKLNVLPQSLTSVIKGNPTISKLMQIAEGIGCDITDLFYPDPADEAAEKAEKERKAREMVESIQQRLMDDIRKNKWANNYGEQGATHRTTLGAPNWSGLTDKNHQFAYSSSPLAFPAVEWPQEGKYIEKLMKDLEAEKENNQENAQQEGTQQENIQPESTQTTIQTSTFCPHCGKKVRVGVVLLPEE